MACEFEVLNYDAEMTANAYNRFRWVECQLISLASCPSSQYHLEKALKSLPRTLDETYKRMLMNIDPDFVDDAKRILTWLCFSECPVTAQELIEGLAVELGEQPRLNCERRLQDPYDIVRICPGLISMVNSADGLIPSNENRAKSDDDDDPALDRDDADSDLQSHAPNDDLHYQDAESPDSFDKDGPSMRSPGLDVASKLPDPALPNLSLRIAHFSVQEYLESERIRSQSPATFALQSHTAHTEIAKTCLVYLQNVRLLDLSEFPLASYAAQHWYIHFGKGDEDCDSLNCLATDFLESKDNGFENWIRIFDPDDYYRFNNRPDLQRPSEDIAPPLYYACLLGLYQPLQSLLENDSVKKRINATGGKFGTALQGASYEGRQQIVQVLLNHGAGVNAQGGFYGGALQAASHQGHEQIVRLLLDHGAEINAQGGYFGNALTAASSQGHEQIVTLLLDHSADINAQGGFYANALEAASDQGHEQIVRLLLDHGAEINAQSGDFGNALAAASDRGHEQIVRLLLNHGAEINAQGGDFGNALIAASYGGHEHIVKVLLAYGAEINAPGGRFGNALQAASHGGHFPIVKLLLDSGAIDGFQGGSRGRELGRCLGRSVKRRSLASGAAAPGLARG
jgi:ankyrin repeat protein